MCHPLSVSPRCSFREKLRIHMALFPLLVLLLLSCVPQSLSAELPVKLPAELLAGAAKIDITNREVPNAPEHLWAKALVLTQGKTTVVLVTLDVVAIGEIGPIPGNYLEQVRKTLQQELGLPAENLLVNASHCHGKVCSDVDRKTVEVIRQAWQNRVPVQVGVGSGHENRIMENRRLLLKSGKQADVRHAYALPADEEVVGIGPTDPEIGVLRLDRLDGTTLAVLFNFACHPIMGTPRTADNTADLTGYAAQVIEDNLGPDTVALFLQGCAGDINPILYKQPHQPRHAEPLGNMLGLSTLKAVRKIECQPNPTLRMFSETLQLPRADHRQRIVALQKEQERLVNSLSGTSLNFKTFVPLLLKYQMSEEYPSYYSHGYLHDQLLGRDDWLRLDTENRRNLDQYLQNILIMEELTRIKANLSLLRRHQAKTEALGTNTVAAEILGLRIGDFTLVTFPGELSVQIGLDIKKAAPREKTFVAGYTNGYLYYAPTEDQLANTGCAQEDCDCLLGPGWLELYQTKVAELLKKL